MDRVLVLCSLALALCSVALAGIIIGCGYVDKDALVREASELLDALPTPKPDEPTPTPVAEDTVVHAPTFRTIQKNSPFQTGVCLATENYVEGLRDKGSSISIIHFRIVNHWNPAKSTTKNYQQLTLGGPGTSNSWNLCSGIYAYTTRHAVNPDTGCNTPGADGTHRGIAIMPFSVTGVYDVYCKAHLTENRGTAFVGFTVEETDGTRSTYWWSWDQNTGKSTDTEVLVAEKVRFKPKGTK